MQEGIHKVLLRMFHIISLTDGVLRTRGWEGGWWCGGRLGNVYTYLKGCLYDTACPPPGIQPGFYF